MKEVEKILTDLNVKDSTAIEIKTMISTIDEKSKEWVKKAKHVVTDPNDLPGMKLAKENRLGIRKERVEMEKFIKSQREVVQEKMLQHTVHDKALLKIFQHFEEVAKTAEAHLQEQEKLAENIENERKAKLKEEREAELGKYVENPENYNLGEMEDGAYETMLEGFKLAKKAKDKEEADALAAEEKKKQEDALKHAKFIERTRELSRFVPMAVDRNLDESEYTVSEDTNQEVYEAMIKKLGDEKVAWDQKKLAEKEEAEKNKKALAEMQETQRRIGIVNSFIKTSLALSVSDVEIKKNKNLEINMEDLLALSVEDFNTRVKSIAADLEKFKKDAENASFKTAFEKWIVNMSLHVSIQATTKEEVIILQDVEEKFKGFKKWALTLVKNAK